MAVKILTAAIAAAVALGGWFLRRRYAARIGDEPTKGQKSLKKLLSAIVVLGGYVAVVYLIDLLVGAPPKKEMHVSIAPERFDFFGLSLSTTTLFTWIIMAVLILAALILRLTVLRRLETIPKGIQNVLEVAVEYITDYTAKSAHGVGEILASYLFTVAAFLVACACLELFGFRTPAADITMTGALAIITFVLINFYGIYRKGLRGRIKALASPTPVVLPIKLITDLAIPVSLASRLFGNMLGGLVVMELLRNALGKYAVGIPSVAGLYFNVFHPLIQAYIFVTLSLTFINEATE
jgi:F-type H+-transporting ATPase subunit a